MQHALSSWIYIIYQALTEWHQAYLMQQNRQEKIIFLSCSFNLVFYLTRSIFHIFFLLYLDTNISYICVRFYIAKVQIIFEITTRKRNKKLFVINNTIEGLGEMGDILSAIYRQKCILLISYPLFFQASFY